MSLCFTLCHSRGVRASLPPIPEIALQIIQTREGTLLSGVSMFINIWIIWSKQLIYTLSKHVREPFSKKYQCFEKYDKKNCFANYPNTWGSASLRSFYVYKHSNNMIKIIALQIMQMREGARASWTLINI